MQTQKAGTSLGTKRREYFRAKTIEGIENAAFKRLKNFGMNGINYQVLREAEITKSLLAGPSQRILKKLGVTSEARQRKIFVHLTTFLKKQNRVQLVRSEYEKMHPNEQDKTKTQLLETKFLFERRKFTRSLVALFDFNYAAAEKYLTKMEKLTKTLYEFHTKEVFPKSLSRD